MFPDGWSAFRRERLTTLMRRLRTTVKSIRPAAMVSAAVSPIAENARARYFQDWSGWASAGLLDVICPMAYAPGLGEFSQSLARARASANGLPLWAGIGAWQLPASATIEHVQAARQAGASGVLLFSYDALTAPENAASEYLASLRKTLLGTPPE
jgi:uncharacterized lipoprotein YddW (UPF0748 family)